MSYLTHGILVGAGLTLGIFVAKPARSPVEPRELRPHMTPEPTRAVAIGWEEAQSLSVAVREDVLMHLINELSVEEIEAKLGELEYPHDIQVAKRLILRLAETNPERALAVLDSLPVSNPIKIRVNSKTLEEFSRSAYRRHVLLEWADSDVEAAIEHATASDEGVIENIISRVMNKNRDKAMELYDRFDIPIPTDLLIDWRRGGIDEIFADAESIEDPTIRSRARASALRRRAKEDPDAVRDLILSLPPGTQVESTSWGWLSTTYRGRDCLELRTHTMGDSYKEKKWASSKLSMTPSFRTSASNVFDWAKSEPRAAVAWAAEQPEGARDYFTAQALMANGLSDPESAVAQLETLSETRRREAAAAIAPEWYHRDQAAAQAWAESLVEPELREHVLGAIDKAD